MSDDLLGRVKMFMLWTGSTASVYERTKDRGTRVTRVEAAAVWVTEVEDDHS